MFLGRPENDYSDVSPTALSPSNQEDFYSTLTRGKEFLNITTLAMSTSSIYDKARTGTGDLHFEPMYVDVVSERPATRKSSRKLKCLVVWLVMLTIISLTSLSFTTMILYKTGMANRSGAFFGDSSSYSGGKYFHNYVVKKDEPLSFSYLLLLFLASRLPGLETLTRFSSSLFLDKRKMSVLGLLTISVVLVRKLFLFIFFFLRT